MRCIATILTSFLFSALSFAAAGSWTASGKVAAMPDKSLRIFGGSAVLLNSEKDSGGFENFELSCEVLTAENATGFIAFHTDADLSKGYKVAIDNSRKSKTWWRKTGSLLGVRNIVKRMADDGKWARVDVKVSGNLVEVSVDGHKLVEYAQPEKPFRLPQNKNAVLGSGAVAIKCVSGQYIDAQKAKAQSRKYGINYAIAVNCGKDFPINKDSLALEFLERNRPEPYVVAMQAEGREWMKLISKPVRDKFAYVFTDAMTFEDRQGNRVHLWKPEEVHIADRQAYMDMITEKICGVVCEPANIYANATYLPAELQPHYAELWTEARREKVLDALVKGGMALEISARYKIPDAKFIKAAKKRGVKFTFGSNNGDSNFGKLEYCLQMAKECALTAEDMLPPTPEERQ